MSEDNSQETSIIKGSALDPLNTIFERFMANKTPFGFQVRQSEQEYHPIPYKPNPADDNDKLLLIEPWRVQLELYADDQRRVLGMDLYGDVILGRGDSRPGRIILNMDPYGAQELGVSREHLMIRPTKTHLFALDQGSTNGTTINGSPSGRGVATQLKNDDLISLGNLLLLVRIISRPDTAKA
jgi:hypothetical protein